MRRTIVMAVALAWLGVAAPTSTSSVTTATARAGTTIAPPAGASARCADGTYSESKRHSGTCSHHGGVAQWLDSRSSKASTRTSHASASIALGKTILLGRRIRTGRCTLGPDPDRRCSPGAYYSKLTKRVICSSSFRTGAVRDVSESEKHSVEREYGLAPRSYGSSLEIDHIVSLELGGSNSIANLFPEKADADPGYHVKDLLENKLHELVCSGSMTLRAAQSGIARNWQASYARVFGEAPA